MATSPLPPLPVEELRRQAEEKKRQAAEAGAKEDFDLAAEFSQQAEDFQRQATNPESSATVHNKWRKIVLVCVAVLLIFLAVVFMPRSSKKTTTMPVQAKQTATTPTQPVSEATEPAKTATQFTPSNSHLTAPATRDLTGQAPPATADFPSFVSEIKKLRSEIGELKNRLSAVPTTPIAPTINFPSDITVRLVQSPQEGSQQTKWQQQPTQPEHHQLSDEERAKRGWEQYQRSYNQP